MKYAQLQASISHYLAEKGELDDNGNPIVAVGKICDTYQEYQASKGSENKIADMLGRMKVHNLGIFDINGREIKVGDDIVYVAQKEKTIYTVIIENGEVGFTVKNKDPNYNFYRSIYLFVPEVDNYKTFEIINEN
jgi:hypothetical protein